MHFNSSEPFPSKRSHTVFCTVKHLTQALYHLAARPDVASVLHEEVQAVVEKGGWSKSAIGQMSKVDSFLKESLRFSSLAARSPTSYPKQIGYHLTLRVFSSDYDT
jgi:hypothetical protein